MTKKRSLAFPTATICLALVASLVSCATTTQSPNAFSHKDAADLFGIGHVPQFEFTLPDDQWQWVQANATREQYVKAD